MEETKKPKVSRENVYRSEEAIQEKLGENYNNIMSHRMKEKDTFKVVFPSSDIWGSGVIFKTTNQFLQPTSYNDPHLDKHHFFKMDAEKKYYEEMAKAKNIMGNKKKEEGSDKK
jgi:hypothetical protein